MWNWKPSWSCNIIPCKQNNNSIFDHFLPFLYFLATKLQKNCTLPFGKIEAPKGKKERQPKTKKVTNNGIDKKNIRINLEQKKKTKVGSKTRKTMENYNKKKEQSKKCKKKKSITRQWSLWERMNIVICSKTITKSFQHFFVLTSFFFNAKWSEAFYWF